MSLTPTLTPRAKIIARASLNESQAFDDGVNASFGFFQNPKLIEYWSFLRIFLLAFWHHNWIFKKSMSIKGWEDLRMPSIQSIQTQQKTTEQFCKRLMYDCRIFIWLKTLCQQLWHNTHWIAHKSTGIYTRYNQRIPSISCMQTWQALAEHFFCNSNAALRFCIT